METSDRELLMKKVEEFDPYYIDDHNYACEFLEWIDTPNMKGIIFYNQNELYCHPHIYIATIDSDNIIAIRLDKPKYFKPKKYTARLSEIQLDEFIKFLSIISNDKFNDTNWEWINISYEGIRKIFKRGPKKIPDYTKLNK